MMLNDSRSVTKEQAEVLANEYRGLVKLLPFISAVTAVTGQTFEEYLTEVGNLWQKIADSK